MKTIFHYDAGPPLMARLAALAADRFEIIPCPEEDERRFAACATAANCCSGSSHCALGSRMALKTASIDDRLGAAKWNEEPCGRTSRWTTNCWRKHSPIPAYRRNRR